MAREIEYEVKIDKITEEVNRKYPELLIVSREVTKGYHGVMIEIKYQIVREVKWKIYL